jgi:hypothetical protein
MISQENETVETGETAETLFYMTFNIRRLGCEKKRTIPQISKNCYFSKRFPKMEL